MKKLTATLAILLKLCLAFSQKGSTSFLNSGSKYYDSTDFSKVDALTSWFYVLTDKNMSYEDPVKPIGQLIFQKDQKTRGIPQISDFKYLTFKTRLIVLKNLNLLGHYLVVIHQTWPGTLL
jgi:hypothetical protein